MCSESFEVYNFIFREFKDFYKKFQLRKKFETQLTSSDKKKKKRRMSSGEKKDGWWKAVLVRNIESPFRRDLDTPSIHRTLMDSLLYFTKVEKFQMARKTRFYTLSSRFKNLQPITIIWILISLKRRALKINSIGSKDILSSFFLCLRINSHRLCLMLWYSRSMTIKLFGWVW